MVRSRVFRSMGEIRYLGLDQYLVCKGTTAAEALLSDVQKRLGNACAETVKRWSTVSLLRWLVLCCPRLVGHNPTRSSKTLTLKCEIPFWVESESGT